MSRTVAHEPHGEVTRAERQPTPAARGELERYDCEYKRNGTAHLFSSCSMRIDPGVKLKSRIVVPRKVTRNACTNPVDVHYPDAEYLRVVQDNLSIHAAGARYATFPPARARRILRRLEFHYTPRRASWLNVVESEIGVLRSQCLDRLDNKEQLKLEVAAWERQRNAPGAGIKWMFTTQRPAPR
jgi:hypothetical protein